MILECKSKLKWTVTNVEKSVPQNSHCKAIDKRCCYNVECIHLDEITTPSEMCEVLEKHMPDEAYTFTSIIKIVILRLQKQRFLLLLVNSLYPWNTPTPRNCLKFIAFEYLARDCKGIDRSKLCSCYVCGK